jgi:cob(I)alamin adenosyltransferase
MDRKLRFWKVMIKKMEVSMKGYVQVYTGDGKGKTTAALGLTLRAVGAGRKVYIAHFMKKGDYSEMAAMKSLSDWVTSEQFGTGRFVRGNPDETDRAAARKGLEALTAALEGGLFQLVIADEINVAAACGLLDAHDLLDLISRRPAQVELVLTGRGALPDVVAAADLVTEMRSVKHYFEQGVAARKGIEF